MIINWYRDTFPTIFKIFNKYESCPWPPSGGWFLIYPKSLSEPQHKSWIRIVFCLWKTNECINHYNSALKWRTLKALALLMLENKHGKLFSREASNFLNSCRKCEYTKNPSGISYYCRLSNPCSACKSQGAIATSHDKNNSIATVCSSLFVKHNENYYRGSSLTLVWFSH